MSDRGRVVRNCQRTDESRRAGFDQRGRASGYHAAVAMLAIVLLVSSLASLASPANLDDGGAEPLGKHQVAFSFVFMGCNRVLKGDKSADDPSTANLPQLERSFTEIAALRPRPAFVVFTGDMVLGLTADLTELRHQLHSWIDVYRNSDLGRDSKIRLIAMPGNHESLVGEKGAQTSNSGAEAVWLAEMQPFIAGNNGPPAGGPDNLQTDQSQLTYSFDFHNSHFVILNTDPFGAVATVPINWIHQDLAAAAGDPKLKHVFVMGHKPAFTPSFASSEQSLDTNPDLRNLFWDELNSAGVGYYLVAHSHIWDFSTPVSPISLLSHTVQIIAGNAGTKLDAGWALTGADPYFGFTLVRVHQNGEVVIKSYGRDFDPTNYLAPSPPDEFPTTIRFIHQFPRGQ